MYKRIVVGVAMTEGAKEAAAAATDLAQRYGAALHAVTAFDRGAGARDSTARQHAEALLSSWAAAAPIAVETHALPGDPADTLLMVASEVHADLVVVGNRGMRGARRVLGSVPNKVAHGAPCSVLIVDTTP